MSDETIPVPIETQLDALCSAHTAGDLSKGLVYGIAGPDGLRHAAGFGAVDDAGLVPDADTVFPIASMTKSFVACAALVARDRGLLSLDDPITRHVKEFKASGTAEDPCDPPTLGMLLSMSGGLTEDNSWIDPFIDTSEEDLLARIGAGLHYSHVPGAVYEYSNVGYALAGIAIARAVGMPIEAFVRDAVLRPLGLTSTWFDNAAPSDRARATGYHLDTEARWVAYPHTSSRAFAAAGGLMSSVRDLATWIAWLGAAFRPPAGDAPEVLCRASRREMQRLQIADVPSLSAMPGGSLKPSISGYGLGLRIDLDLQRGTIVSHGGGLPGFSLFMCWHPESGHGTVVLTNSHRGSASDVCTDALSRLLAFDRTPAQTVTLWPETVRLRQKAERLIRDWDDGLAADVFADNVAFDRPLDQRRAEIDDLVARVGPLGDPRPVHDIVSAATPADVTWSIPAAHGELLCMIHLTPVRPGRIQEFVVRAIPAQQPRSAAPVDISPRRTGLGDAYIWPAGNVRVTLP